MDRPDTIQLLFTEHGIDASKATHLQCAPGTVLLEMLPEAEKIGCIFLPSTVSGRYRPDVGIVLSVGRGVALAPGQTVAIRPYDGRWIAGFDFGGYTTPNEIRIYGKATPFQGEIERVPWAESIPLIIHPDTMDITPTGNNVVIRRDPLVTQEKGFELPTTSQYRTGTGTIEAIGPEADLAITDGQAKPGDRVLYDTRGELDFAFAGDPDLVLIPDLAIDLVLSEAA